MHPLRYAHAFQPILTRSEAAAYNLSNLFVGRTNRGVRPRCLETEISDTIARKYKIPHEAGIQVPFEVLLRHASRAGIISAMHNMAGSGAVLDGDRLRTMSVSSSPAGGYLVGDGPVVVEDVFRPVSAAVRLGAGLFLDDPDAANKRFAVVETDPTLTWAAENEHVSESTPAITSRDPGLWRLAGGVKISKQLLAQTNGETERFVGSLLLAAAGSAIDRALLVGAGMVEPVGILNQEGVASFTFGGAADFGDLVDTTAGLLAADVPLVDGAGWAVSPNTYKKWRKAPIEIGSGRMLLDGGPAEGGWRAAGFRAEVTSHLAATDRAIFGRFASAAAYLVGGPALPILVDGYTYASSFAIEVWSDSNWRLDLRPGAFARSTDSAAQ